MLIDPKSLGNWVVRHDPKSGTWIVLDEANGNQLVAARSEELATVIAAVPRMLRFFQSMLRPGAPPKLDIERMLELAAIKMDEP